MSQHLWELVDWLAFLNISKSIMCNLTNCTILTAWSVQTRSFFSSVFTCIRTEYGDLQSEVQYSVQMWENIDLKKLRIRILFAWCLLLYHALNLHQLRHFKVLFIWSDDITPTFIWKFFQPGRNNEKGWDDFSPSFWSWNCLSGSMISPWS